MTAKKPNQKIIDSLTQSLSTYRNPISIADAASKSGLSFADTKNGLNFLLAEYRGSIAATNQGELLYAFPYGFVSFRQQELFEKIWLKTKNAFMGGLKFLVRAWISVVMVAYVAIFAIILIALSLKGSDERENNSSLGSSLMLHALLRMVLDSLFWTFHPFSPFYYNNYEYRSYNQVKKAPFYERVNNFFFGPQEIEVSQEQIIKNVLQEIRAQKGRIGIFDIMKVTGFSKKEADPFMAKLMLDYNGEVHVSEEGGIYYEFIDIRKTALNEINLSPKPIWHQRAVLPSFTGNTFSSNALIIGLNGFNLIMSLVAITNHWSIERLTYLFHAAASKIPSSMLIPAENFSSALILGWIPFLFSSFLFSIPLMRLLGRSKKAQKIATYNGKVGLIKSLVTKLTSLGIKEHTLKQDWQEQALEAPDEKIFIKEVVKLGGTIELDEQDQPMFRFKDLESEKEALQKARKHASASESYVGQVVFDSRN